MDLLSEAVIAMGNAEPLRNRIRDASSDICAALMGAIGLGSKPNYPWDQYPSRARTKILDPLPKRTGYLLDVKVHEARSINSE